MIAPEIPEPVETISTVHESLNSGNWLIDFEYCSILELGMNTDVILPSLSTAVTLPSGSTTVVKYLTRTVSPTA